MKLQSIVYTVLSTVLTAANAHALPNKSDLLVRNPPSVWAALAPGWRVAGPCMVLNDESNLNGVQWSILHNTPEACTTYCSTAPTDDPPHYTFAAVGGSPYGDGCYCGFDSDYNQVLARRAYIHECDAPCSGDSNLACGRGDRVQVYTRSPDPTPTLSGWSVVSDCSVDTAERVLEGNNLFSLMNNSPAFCTTFCEHTTYSENGVDKRYTWAGVENGDECHCGTGWKGGVVPPSAPRYDCATPCVENPTDPNGCGGSWRIQVFKNPNY